MNTIIRKLELARQFVIEGIKEIDNARIDFKNKSSAFNFLDKDYNIPETAECVLDNLDATQDGIDESLYYFDKTIESIRYFITYAENAKNMQGV